jgi:tight adherence protein C
MAILLYITLTLTVFLVLALLLAPVLLAPSLGARRILDMVQSTRPDQRRISSKERIKDSVLSIAKGFRSRFGLVEDDKLKQRLSGAGLKSTRSVNLYFASRFFGPILGIVLGTFIHTNTIFWALSFGAVFYLIPDMWLGMRTKKRRAKIRNGLPDALDLLVICVEAGLGLDQAMLRVGQELIISHPEINQEFKQINLEQLAGKPRLEAWKSAATRTQVPEFSLFVTMLSQADRFGTPIVRALSRFADELRMKRRQRSEEMAAKTKIKILFPLVLFIFPCIFIVLLAPAILSIAKNLQALK